MTLSKVIPCSLPALKLPVSKLKGISVSMRSIASPKLADTITKQLDLTNYPGGRTVIEYHPGAGLLTRALINGGAARVHCIEPMKRVFPYLTGDSRVEIVEHVLKFKNRGHASQSVFALPTKGKQVQTLTGKAPLVALTGLERENWANIHPSVSMTGIIDQSKAGPDLALLHLFQLIMDRESFYFYGRIPAVFLVRHSISSFLTATAGNPARNTISIQSELLVDIEKLGTFPEDAIWPPVEMDLIRITPKKSLSIKSDLDYFLRCVRQIFAIRRQPLRRSIKVLGAGAEVLLKGLNIDPATTFGTDLTLEQLDAIAMAYQEWPHRPSDLNFT